MAPSVLRLRHVLRLQVITVVTFGCAVLYCIQSINEMILAPNCFDPLCPHAWEQRMWVRGLQPDSSKQPKADSKLLCGLL